MTGATQDSLSKLIEGKTERMVVLTGKDAVPVQVRLRRDAVLR